MILANGNISPLAFYSDINLQSHRRNCAYGQVWPLMVPSYSGLYIPPFQVVISRDNTGTSMLSLSDDNSKVSDILTETGTLGEIIGGTIEGGNISDGSSELAPVLDTTITVYSAYIYNLTTGAKKSFNLLSALKWAQTSDPDVRIMKFYGSLELGFREGQYYLAIELRGTWTPYITLYSEVFCYTYPPEHYLEIMYTNSYNFKLPKGEIDFSNNFMFLYYTKARIGKPEYTFEEEASERMGRTFIESQVSKKTYRFTDMAPEYLCDALRIIRLCDTKVIREYRNIQISSASSETKSREYRLTTFSMEPEWQEQGDLAAVECEFETDTVIANVGGYSPETE